MQVELTLAGLATVDLVADFFHTSFRRVGSGECHILAAIKREVGVDEAACKGCSSLLWTAPNSILAATTTKKLLGVTHN